MSNLIWRFLERCGAQLVTFIVSIVLARILDPTVYGTIALVTVITTILQVFVDSGFSTALVQKKDADDTDFSTVFYFNIATCVLLYVLLFFAAPLIAAFYEMPDLTPVIRVLGLTLIVSGLKSVQQAYVSKHMLFKKFFFSTIGGTIAAAVVGIGMAIYGFGVWALVGQYLVNLIAGTAVLWITVKWRPKKLFSWQRLKGLFSFGWKILVSGLLETLYQDIRQLIIGKKYSSEDLAFYNRGQQFPSLIVTNINSSIDSVLFPVMSKEQKDKSTVKAMTRRAIKTSSFIMWPLMVGLGVCAEPIVRLLLTDKWIFCVPYLRIFCFTYAFYPIHTANLNAIKAMGRSDLYLRLEIIKKTIGVILLLSTMWFGVLVMAYSLLLSTIVSSFVNAFPNKKLLGYSYIEQIKDILPSILLAGVMGVVVFCVQFIHLADIWTLIIQVTLGALIYIVGAKLLKMESFEYIWNLAKSFLKKRKSVQKTQPAQLAQPVQKPTVKEIEAFLYAVDKDFPVAISEKVDLKEYAKKLFDNATFCYEYQNGVIAAMVAGYTHNLTENLAFVSIMATRKEYRGQGLASKQLAKFLEESRKAGAKGVHVYAVESNLPAVATYKKLGFERYAPQGEPRPEDLHLITYFKEKKE